MMLEDGKTLIDLIPDTSTEDEDYTQVEKTERSEQLNLAFFRLEELDRDIVIKHYGINQPRPMTLDEIAKSHKLCRQSVGVRKQKAMNILRLTMAQRLKEPEFH
jgi:DNA-directed RNA polymerase sigma subunit (sigma70/sigma32)